MTPSNRVPIDAAASVGCQGAASNDQSGRDGTEAGNDPTGGGHVTDLSRGHDDDQIGALRDRLPHRRGRPAEVRDDHRIERLAGLQHLGNRRHGRHVGIEGEHADPAPPGQAATQVLRVETTTADPDLGPPSASCCLDARAGRRSRRRPGRGRGADRGQRTRRAAANVDAPTPPLPPTTASTPRALLDMTQADTGSTRSRAKNRRAVDNSAAVHSKFARVPVWRSA